MFEFQSNGCRVGKQTGIVGRIKLVVFFSSPEHEVLRMSYCDRSVVRHPSLCPSVRLSLRPSVHNYKKKNFSPKLTIRFQANFTEMILRLCSLKILQRIEFLEELWLLWQQSEKKFKKNSCPKP